ncbi:MAG: pitrilysin family protein [bacterium]
MKKRVSLFAAAGAITLLGAVDPATADPAPFTVHTLDNGLTVVLAPSDAHPVVSVSLYVATGGRTEDEYYQGSLHYIEHLVYKGGTPNLPPTEFRKTMSRLGREIGGWTWDDEINFGFEAPEENFAAAFPLFREAMLDLDFTKDWFEDEKLVVLQEMTRGREQPDNLLWEAWGETAYEVHPYRRSVIGTEKAIRELDMDRTFQYYRDRFTPNHMILSVAGDFTESEMLATLERDWGKLSRGPESFELGLVEPEQQGPRTRIDFLPQAQSALSLIGIVCPGGNHEDVPALEMLAALLNDSSYGLPQFLEEQKKWALSVSADCYVKRDASDFTIQVRTDPEKHPAVRTFAQDFLLDFDVTSVPEEIFEQTKRGVLFHEAAQRETNADRAGRYGFLVSRRGAAAAAALTDRWAALTREDVQAAKERWISPRRLVTATVYPDDFDPAAADPAPVEPGAPFAGALPELDVAGGLRPADGTPLSYEKTDEAGDVSEYTYANGMRVLVRRSAGSPLVAISSRILGGQWVEPKGQEGINLFVSELGLRSTRRWDREGFSRLLASRSIAASAHTSSGSRANTSRHVDYRDAAGQHYRGLVDEWPAMLACLKETMFFPDFRDAAIEKLREDLVNQARLLPENNLEYVKQEFYDRVFAGHPYGRPTFGSEASLSAITPAQLQAFHRGNWRPDRIVLSIVGDVDPDRVAEWIASHWADIPRDDAKPWSIDPASASIAWDPPADRQVLDLGKNYWTVNWGRPGSSMTDGDHMTSVVLARLAGNDHFYKYVYGEGVSYRSWINFWEHLGAGTWILENDVKRDRFDEILDMFDADLARYEANGFTQDEFDDAIRQLTNRQVLGAQDNARTAWRLAVAEGDGIGFRSELEYVDDLGRVTPEAVNGLAKTVFDPAKIYRLQQQ